MSVYKHNFRRVCTVDPVQWSSIMKTAARQWCVTVDDIQSTNRNDTFVRTRDACCAMAVQLTDLNYTELAIQFGSGRTRSAVSYAVARAERRFLSDPVWSSAYLAALNRIVRMHGGMDKQPTVMHEPSERRIGA